MSRLGEMWQLRCGDEVLGDITIVDGDFPWLIGDFVARVGFAEVAPLFAEELALLEGSHDEADGQTWEMAYERITRTMTLVTPSGPVAEFLLHVDADAAWFRWSDEPFDER